MAVNPKTRKDPAPRCRLAPFEVVWSQRVISWVQDAREAYWLAPKTPPPLSPDEMLHWREPGHDAYLLWQTGRAEPAGYGELNRLGTGRRHYWLGHLIVDPAQRGRGYGVQLTQLLLEEAFQRRGAIRVTLVVFPENHAALACYQAAGMREDGYEWHSFPAYGRRECLLRLAASAGY